MALHLCHWRRVGHRRRATTRHLPETQRFESLHQRSVDPTLHDDPAVHAHIVPNGSDCKWPSQFW